MQRYTKIKRKRYHETKKKNYYNAQNSSPSVTGTQTQCDALRIFALDLRPLAKSYIPRKVRARFN